MLRELGAGDWAHAASRELAAWELEREVAYTRPIAKMAEYVRLWAESGKRVVAVSDTRYTAPELAILLFPCTILPVWGLSMPPAISAEQF